MMDWLLWICMWYHMQIQWEMRIYRSLEWTRHEINLTDLPPEIILMILEILLTIDPITLLGSVPGVCRQIRALCSGVHGTFDLRGEWARLEEHSVIQGALNSASLHFPRTAGLWTFSRFPLLDSCKAGLLEVTDALLKEDASKVDERNRCGRTPLFFACEKGHLELVRLLLEKGASIDNATIDGNTPLYTACQNGRLDVARLLLEKGADTEKARNDGHTPLFIACWWGYPKVAGLLLERGANIDKASKYGATPFFVACQNGNLKVARLLLEKGADMNKARNDGCTPLEIALRVRCTKIIALLEQADAWQ